MLYQHTPAGQSVSLQASLQAIEELQGFFRPFRTHWYGSGTMALSAALMAVKQQSSVKTPEVLLPAYACPALVSAALYAGIKPVLVDLEAGCSWMSLQSLEQRLSANVIAVIAVDLFGVPERAMLLRKFTQGNQLFLIEDSAQYFPAKVDPESWFGDYVVLSFGRGKPVSVLQGGVVLARSEMDSRCLPDVPSLVSTGWIGLGRYWLKAALYNGLLSPYCYWLPDSLPFLGLGETRYTGLSALTAASPIALSYLPDNIRQHTLRVALIDQYLDIFADAGGGLQALPGAAECWQGLSRFPVLAASRAQRDSVYSALQECGVGASRMYQQALPMVRGIPAEVAGQSEVPNALRFAECVLTLPIHDRIRNRDLQSIRQIVALARDGLLGL